MASTPRAIEAGVGVGEIFLDKFRVDAILGHGGMGVVAACTHLALNERVAIKMLRRDVLDDADAVERFMREAQAASKLKSEYVARVTDVGRSKANVPYMVMEYLYGHDLDELLAERGSLGMPWAVELTLQACEALGEAHSLGIVHRDVKPSNLFVTWRPDGSPLVKVLDFGISKALHGESMRLTQTQSLLGTPAYMSPEQMRSARHVDARTDIWSLGTVLYEMLEGRRPFEAESFSEMCVKVAVDPPGPMTRTPLQLQQVVLRCLAKAPEQRYSSMAELGRDLVPFAQDPHHAQVLAERTARTLRRSQMFDGDPSRSGPNLRPTPEPIGAAIPAIAPTPRPSPVPAVDPALAVAPAPALASPPPSHDAAAARRRDGDRTYVVRGRRRWSPVLVVAALAGATAIGVAVSRVRDAEPGQPPVMYEPTSPTAAQPALAPRDIAPSLPGPAQGSAASVVEPDQNRAEGHGAAQPDAALAPQDVTRRATPSRPDRSDRPENKKAGKRDTSVAGPPCDPFAEARAATACPPGTER